MIFNQGGNVTRLYSAQQMRSVYGMEVFRDSVYWVNYANSKDIIYKGPKQKITGTDVDIQMLTAIGYVSPKLCHFIILLYLVI